VTIGVIDPLETVQIDHGQAEAVLIEQQPIQPLVEEAPVVKAGQLVEVACWRTS
jgi:hypothetical protein